MKVWQKVSATVLAVGMTAGFAACGGDKEVKGQTFENEAAWVQACEDTYAATNATMQYSTKISASLDGAYEKSESTATVKIADGKVYYNMSEKASWRGEIDGVVEQGEETETSERYIATVDGVVMSYEKENGGAWEKDTFRGNFEATLGWFILERSEIINDVSGLYSVFENNGGTYVTEEVEEEGVVRAELKFTDGKMYSYKMTGDFAVENGDGETFSQTYEISLSFSYGNTSVGDLPVVEEKDPVGEQVSEAEFEAAVAATKEATNFTAEFTYSDGTETYTCADGKVYGVSNRGGKTTYAYVGAVDGEYYLWTSSDGTNWEWDVAEVEGNPATGEAQFGEALQWCVFTYWEFNDVTGMFEFTNFGQPTVYAMVSDGKIVKLHYEEDQTNQYDCKITYNNATVGELPPLD